MLPHSSIFSWLTSRSQFSHNTREIQDRHIQFAKRQMVDNTFNDEHYATFYGGDFSNVSLSDVLSSLSCS